MRSRSPTTRGCRRGREGLGEGSPGAGRALLLPSPLSTATRGLAAPLPSLPPGTAELCSPPRPTPPPCSSHSLRGGRFYNPRRSSRSLRSAPGGLGHAPWSAPAAQTLPEHPEAAPASPPSWGSVPPAPCRLPCPRQHNAHMGSWGAPGPFRPRHQPPPGPAQRPAPLSVVLSPGLLTPALPSSSPGANTGSEGPSRPPTAPHRPPPPLTSSRPSNILEPEPSGNHLHGDRGRSEARPRTRLRALPRAPTAPSRRG